LLITWSSSVVKTQCSSMTCSHTALFPGTIASISTFCGLKPRGVRRRCDLGGTRDAEQHHC
jgi:hypothetical protein